MGEDSTASPPSTGEISKKSVGEGSAVCAVAEVKSVNDNQVKKKMSVFSQMMSECLDEIIDQRQKNKDLQKTIYALERTVNAHEKTLKVKNELIDKLKGNQRGLDKALYEARAGERGATIHLHELQSEIADLKHSFSCLKRELMEDVDTLRSSFTGLSQSTHDGNAA